jgi:KipI family sensor histidine kinase inhibitor
MGSQARWRWSGDRALLREIEQGDFALRNARARALYQRLTERRFDEVEDVVPGAASVVVLLLPGAEPSPVLLEALDRDLSDAGTPREARRHEIDVGYGGSAGPDLAEVARLRGMTEQEVVELHCTPTYTVGFLGFAPGFAYLIGLPAALETPRLATPRTRVPAGSVAIGGSFTAVYPRATPGGWRLLGLTDFALFDLSAPSPARLAPGDQVKFVPR